MIEKFENQLNKHTIVLIRHLVKTEQAKNGVVNFMSQVLDLDKEEALKFYKEYGRVAQ